MAMLRLDTPYLPCLQRLHDSCMMNVIQSSDTFTPAEVCRLNYWRLYLKAITLSDLTSINGRALDHSKFLGNPSLLSHNTHGTSIYQLRRKANAIWSNPDSTIIQPLGNWVLPLHSMHQRHPAFWFSGLLWVDIRFKYIQCNPVSDLVFWKTPISCDWTNLPKQAVPMLLSQAEPGFWRITQQSHILEVDTPPTAGTFIEYIASLPSWEMELLQHVEMEDDPFTVAAALELGVQAVSDGSDWHQIQGSFGWEMSTDIGERCAYGMGPARSASPHGYRSQSYGLLSLLCFFRQVAEFTGKHDLWFGIIATDSQSLINTILQKKPRDPSSSTMAMVTEADLVLKRSFPLDPSLPE